MSDKSKKTVAFCGSRGIPPKYGGFETVVDEISKRFIEKGYSTEVFCRRSSYSNQLDSYNGNRLIYVNGSKRRKLDTVVSSIQTGLYILKNRKQYSFVFWYNNANFPGIMLTLLAGIPMAINTNGLEWRREKWSFMFKAYYFISTYLISKLCKTLISDSNGICDYYKEKFNKRSQFIPYGVYAPDEVASDRVDEILNKYGLSKSKFFLQVTRLEPDNYPLEAARAFQKSGLGEKGYRYVVIGYQNSYPYSDSLKKIDNQDGVMVLDAIYDQEILAALRASCFCYVHGNHVGGTNPALLEAMISCPRVISVDISFNREVLGETGFFFKIGNLDILMNKILNEPDLSDKMKARAESHYRWDAVSDSYMRVAQGLDADYNSQS